MKFKIVHDTPGRIRLRCGGYYFDKNQEKSLEKTILSEQYVESVKAKSVNGGILITYQSDYRQELLNYIKGIKRNQLAAVEDESEDIQADFKNEIIKMLIKRFVLRRILPYPVRVAMAYFKAFPYVKKAVGSVLNLRPMWHFWTVLHSERHFREECIRKLIQLHSCLEFRNFLKNIQENVQKMHLRTVLQ